MVRSFVFFIKNEFAVYVDALDFLVGFQFIEIAVNGGETYGRDFEFSFVAYLFNINVWMCFHNFENSVVLSRVVAHRSFCYFFFLHDVYINCNKKR